MKRNQNIFLNFGGNLFLYSALGNPSHPLTSQLSRLQAALRRQEESPVPANFCELGIGAWPLAEKLVSRGENSSYFIANLLDLIRYFLCFKACEKLMMDSNFLFFFLQL